MCMCEVCVYVRCMCVRKRYVWGVSVYVRCVC